MPTVETVEVNGVIVNKGEEETAEKWAKTPAKEEADKVEDAPKGKKKADKE